MIVFTFLQMSDAAGRTHCQRQRNPSKEMNRVASLSKPIATTKNDDVYNAPSMSNTLSPIEIRKTKNASGFSQADVEKALRENILVGPIQQVKSTFHVFLRKSHINVFLLGKILVLRRKLDNFEIDSIQAEVPLLETTQNNVTDKANEVNNTNQLDHDKVKFSFDYNLILIAYSSLYRNI